MKVLGIRAYCALVLALGSAGIGLAPAAFAHHGWTWAVEEQSTLDGVIEEISMAPPHPALKIKAQDGARWQIDLGNPAQTARSGFTAASTKPGDAVRVLGNRHKDANVKQMKAVRITIDGKSYDMYPERLQAD